MSIYIVKFKCKGQEYIRQYVTPLRGEFEKAKVKTIQAVKDKFPEVEIELQKEIKII